MTGSLLTPSVSHARSQAAPQLERALVGRFGPHQRFLVAQHLDHLDFLDERIEQVSAEIAARPQPVSTIVAQLDTIPGVGQRTAEVLVARSAQTWSGSRQPTTWRRGRGCARPPPECWPAAEWKDPIGEPMAARCLGRGGWPNQGLLLTGAVPASGGNCLLRDCAQG